MHGAGKTEGVPKQHWYILTQILCRGGEGGGGGVKHPTRPAAHGGRADPVSLCCVVVSHGALGGGGKLQHRRVVNGGRIAGYTPAGSTRGVT